MPALVKIVIIAALLSSGALRAQAQGPVRDTSGRLPPAQDRSCSPGLELYRTQMRSLSTHAGWGMLIGGVLGTAYGIAQARAPLRGLVIIGDGFLGGASGMAVGGAVFAVRRLRGYSPPIAAPCRDVPPTEELNPAAHRSDAGGSLRSPAAFYYQRRRLTPAR
jgi:hypothetical protein